MLGCDHINDIYKSADKHVYILFLINSTMIGIKSRCCNAAFLCHCSLSFYIKVGGWGFSLIYNYEKSASVQSVILR